MNRRIPQDTFDLDVERKIPVPSLFQRARRPAPGRCTELPAAEAQNMRVCQNMGRCG